MRSRHQPLNRFRNAFCVLITASLLVSSALADESEHGPQIPGFEGVKSFLRTHCAECHGSKKQEGDVRFDKVSNTISNANEAEHWQNVLDALNLGEMPPEDRARPANDELTTTIDALTRGLFEARTRLSSSSDIVVRRLNRREYKNTVEELLGVPVPTGRLPEDDSFQGFDTLGQAQTMSALHINRYLEVAREALGRTLTLEKLPSQVTRFDADEREYRKMRKKGVDSLANKLRPTAKKPITDPAARKKVEKALAEAKERFAVTDTIPGVKTGFLMANPWAPSSKSSNAASMIEIPGTGWEGTLAAKGSYIARVNAGLTVAAPGETHFLEFHRVDRFGGKQLLGEYVGTVRIDSTVKAPRVYEVPFEIDWKSEGVKIENIALVVPSHQAAELKNRAKSAQSPNDVPMIWVDWIEIEGPLDMGVDGRQRILFRGKPGSSEAGNDEYAREIIDRFSYEAFRHRKPSAPYVDAIFKVYRDQRDAGVGFVEAIQESLAVVLSSPGFLYLTSPGDRSGRLSGVELACRISYLLWSSAPDKDLYAVAESGRLLQGEELDRQVERMLDDPRSARFVEAFVSQWLELDWLDMIVVEKQFQFTDGRRDSARRETLEFFAELIRKDLSAKNLIESDFVMVDHVLAEFYGLKTPLGEGFRRAELPDDSPRGGLLGQTSVLTMTSTGSRTSPVERGVFVLEKLRGTPPPPPPPNVPQLEVQGTMSVQEMVELHASSAQCASCHRRFDPFGVALESFDVVGMERKPSKDYPFETKAKAIDGRSFDGPKQLKALLMDDAGRMTEGLLKSVLTFAWGRPVGFSDELEVQQTMKQWAKADYGMRSLIRLAVQTKTFRSN